MTFLIVCGFMDHCEDLPADNDWDPYLSKPNDIQFPCPGCGKPLAIPESYLGVKCRCDACGAKFRMDDDETAETPSAPQEPTAPRPRPVRRKPLLAILAPTMAVSVLALVAAALMLHAGRSQKRAGSSNNHKRAARSTTSPYTAPIERYGVQIVDWKKARRTPSDEWLDVLDREGAEALKLKLSDWLIARTDATSLAEAVEVSAYRIALARHEVLRGCGASKVDVIAALPQGWEFLHTFLSNPEWMNDMLASGPIKDHARTLRYLYVIWKYDKECEEPLYRRFATAVALEKAGDHKNPPNHYNVIKLFQGYKDNHKQMLLHASFDELETWEMRFTVMTWEPASLGFLVNDRNYQQNRYFGACWACAYKGHNRYGDSIQGPHYYPPWMHVYNSAERGRREGGVCGTLSTYGAQSARAHGIPAMPAGEPGHCAYVVRDDNNLWRVAYHIASPTRPKSHFWGSSVPLLRLMQTVYTDREAVIRARRHCWQAALISDRAAIHLDGPLTCQVYKGKWNSLPDFGKLTPHTTQELEDFAYAPLTAGMGGFGVVFEGGFTLASETTATFATTSDDGSRLSINGEQIVNNDGLHGAVRKEGTTTLPPGRHTLRVDFFDGGGDHSLAVEMETATPPDVLAAYELAVEAHPAHLGIQREYVAALATATDLPEDTWERATQRICRTYDRQHEAALRLLNDIPLKRLADLSQPARVDAIMKWHRGLELDGAQNSDRKDFGGFLSRQADRIADTEQELRFAAKLLNHYKDSSAYFATVFAWAADRYGKKPATAKAFSVALAGFLRTAGDSLQGGTARWMGDAILAAEASGNIDAFRLLSDIATEYVEFDALKARHFNAGQAKNFPGIESFPGELLSQEGILKLSSNHDALSVLVHRDILCETDTGGFFHTGREKKPRATLTLPGQAELSGIVLVNRYESNSHRQVPMTVSVSENNKKWTEVFETTENQPVWRIDLADREDRVKYVRIEVDHGDKSDYFHLRNILVYGKPLY